MKYITYSQILPSRHSSVFFFVANLFWRVLTVGLGVCTCLCVGYNERTALFFFFSFFVNPPRTHLALIKPNSYWSGPSSSSSCRNNGCILDTASSWDRRTKTTHAQTHTRSARTLALLLMSMPCSVLLSSCEARGAGRRHLATLTHRPRLRLNR